MESMEEASAQAGLDLLPEASQESPAWQGAQRGQSAPRPAPHVVGDAAGSEVGELLLRFAGEHQMELRELRREVADWRKEFNPRLIQSSALTELPSNWVEVAGLRGAAQSEAAPAPVKEAPIAPPMVVHEEAARSSKAAARTGLDEAPSREPAEAQERPAAGEASLPYSCVSSGSVLSPATSCATKSRLGGRWRRVSPSHALEEPSTVWQWEHRTGFKDYNENVQGKIERAFQAGESKVRLRAGKSSTQPLEIYFADMLQVDHISGSQRKVRRVGTNDLWRRLTRYVESALKAWQHNKPRMESLEQFRLRQKFVLLDDDQQHELDQKLKFRQDGFCYRLLSKRWFVTAMNAVILANCLWISFGLGFGVEFDAGLASASTVLPHVFLVAFVTELSLRLGAYRVKRRSLSDAWFVFESFLTGAMMIETWMIPLVVALSRDGETSTVNALETVSSIRVLRLLRVVRTGRLLNTVPSFVTIFHGFEQAFRSMAVTGALLVFLIYIFGVGFRTMVVGQSLQVEEDFFPSVIDSMWTLLVSGVLMDDLSDLVSSLRQETTLLAYALIVFIFLSSFTLLNMLVGIVCTVISSVTEENDEKASRAKIRRDMFEILECYDSKGTMDLSAAEFERLLQNPELAVLLSHFDTDVNSVKNLVLASDTLQDNGRVSFVEIVGIVFRLRKGVNASVTDILELQKHFARHLEQEMNLLQNRLADGQQRLAERIAGNRAAIHRLTRTAEAGDSRRLLEDAPSTPKSGACAQSSVECEPLACTQGDAEDQSAPRAGLLLT